MSDINFDKYSNEEFFRLFLNAVKETYGDYCTFKEHEENLTEYSEPAFEKSIGEAGKRIASIEQQLREVNDSLIDSIIKPLFNERWSGELSEAPVCEMRKQLEKTMHDQMMGYWSGHTAYNIAVDGGFIVNDKKRVTKKLTRLGYLFFQQQLVSRVNVNEN